MAATLHASTVTGALPRRTRAARPSRPAGVRGAPPYERCVTPGLAAATVAVGRGADADADDAQLDAVAYTLIIDDIVLPDGQTEMGVLGGSGMLRGTAWDFPTLRRRGRRTQTCGAGVT